ncbi:hypothetical protein Ddc_02083 [Ditylenchus destructor]|nr:hypothetical protein Ddc_02083 [Ditylenchus destructor]
MPCVSCILRLCHKQSIVRGNPSWGHQQQHKQCIYDALSPCSSTVVHFLSSSHTGRNLSTTLTGESVWVIGQEGRRMKNTALFRILPKTAKLYINAQPLRQILQGKRYILQVKRTERNPSQCLWIEERRK